MGYSKYLGIPTHTNDGLYQDPDTGDIAYVKNGVANWSFTEEGALTLASTLTSTGKITAPAGIQVASSGVLKYATKALTNANMLNLRATPITVVAAPGAGKAIAVVNAILKFDYTGAYTESTDNLALKLKDGSGPALAVFEATGFADATTDALVQASIASAIDGTTAAPGATATYENSALVLHNTGDGEWGGGNAANVVTCAVWYVEYTL